MNSRTPQGLLSRFEMIGAPRSRCSEWRRSTSRTKTIASAPRELSAQSGIADKLQTHVVASCCTVGGRVTPSPLTFEAEAVGTEREERVNVRARNDRRDTDEHSCGAGQRIGLQLQQTALTVNAMPQGSDARMLPNSGTASCLLAAASPC